jgi:hypothetical protein
VRVRLPLLPDQRRLQQCTLRWPRETMPANAWYMEQTSAGEEEDLDALIRAPCSESGSEGGGELSGGEESGEEESGGGRSDAERAAVAATDAAAPWLTRLSEAPEPPAPKGRSGPSLATGGLGLIASVSALWARLSARWNALLKSAPEVAEEGERGPLLDHDMERGTSQQQQGSGALSAAAELLVQRLASILCGPNPSAAASRIFLDAVAAASCRPTLGLVTSLEAFSQEELELVQLDAIVEGHSEQVAAAWIKAAFEQFAHSGNLPAVPQPWPVDALLSRRGIINAVVGQYVPLLGGVPSPHLATTGDGHVQATSFALLEMCAAHYLRLCGLGEEARLPI